MKTIDIFLQESNLTVEELAERSGLDAARVADILSGHWLPSPKERTKIADALGTTPEEITWEHATPIQHIYGYGPG